MSDSPLSLEQWLHAFKSKVPALTSDDFVKIWKKAQLREHALYSWTRLLTKLEEVGRDESPNSILRTIASSDDPSEDFNYSFIHFNTHALSRTAWR